MKDPIKDTMRKTLSYWYVDGLTELATGSLLALVSLFYTILAVLVPEATFHQLIGVGLPILILTGGLISRMAVSSLKERLTYPRTGYLVCIKPKTEQKVMAFMLAVAGSLIFVFISTLLKLDWLEYAAPPFMAAIMIAFVGYTYGLRRFYGLAVYILLLGIPMVMLRLNDQINIVMFVAGCGAGLIVSGALTLRGYLQSTQPPLGEIE